MATARRQLGYVSSLTTQTSFVAGAGAPTLYEFTTTGANSWTVPAGVTYVIANIQAGGGAAWMGGTAGTSGGNSSVAFASGTITATGGSPSGTTNTTFSNNVRYAVTPSDYGAGGLLCRRGGSVSLAFAHAHHGTFLRAGGAVTPGSSLTITVGAGGGITGSTYGAAGKQGIVILEAYEGNSKRCDVFTTTGTFNPPLGVDSVTATLIGGGGSCGQGDWSGATGGSTTINFASGTVTAVGGGGLDVGREGYEEWQNYPLPTNNSGRGGLMSWAGQTTDLNCNTQASNGQKLVVQRAVSYGSGLTVTIGSGGAGNGGTSGGSAGCSGVAWIEYEV